MFVICVFVLILLLIVHLSNNVWTSLLVWLVVFTVVSSVLPPKKK